MKRLVVLGVFLVCSGLAAETTWALDPPHDASNSVNCATCHITHHAPGGAITNIAGNPNLCMSCHTVGGLAGSTPFADTDEAIPGTSGRSHRWDAGASGWVKKSPADTSPGSVQSGGVFTGRYAKTYTITVTTAGDAGSARFNWSTSLPVSQTYRDEFTAIAFTGTNGTQSWSATPWQEVVEADGVSAGLIQVVANAACASGNCLRIGGGAINTRAVRRAANLSGGTSAMLTFSYQRQLATCPNTSTANVALQVSADGVAWTTLATYNLNACDAAQVAQAFDVTAYLTATAQIRFLGTGTAGASDFIYIDNVQLEYLASGAAATNVATGSSVPLDEGITVSFTNATPAPAFRLNDQWIVYVYPDINPPVSFALSARLAGDKLTCSTCHNEHSQVAEPFDPAAPPYPALGSGGAGRHFQRLDDDLNQICVDCHSARDVTAASLGSHPVGVTIPATGAYKNP